MKGGAIYNKNIQWELLAADRLLSSKPCWLHSAFLVVSAASTDSYLYDGHDTGGKKIIVLEAALATTYAFKPPKPLYCKQGLYVDVGSNVTAIFVQWEEEATRPPAEISEDPGEPAG